MSPKDFDKCAKAGGRIRTKSLTKSRHIKLCFKDGESVAGEVKKNKTKKKKKS